ncbi:MAG TPA: SBBP repeat-containing protein [Candidatus Acidoferrum sp.]|nr:SBBP repeat-containing protein [Candidatus Acidoferrum sp.]
MAKLNSTSTALVYSTYLGGSDFEMGTGIAVDGSGNIYVTGTTSSPDFPTANPFQAALVPSSDPGQGLGDAFVTKLNPAGTALVYSTYLGGGGFDVAYAIAVDNAGSAYVAGETGSSAFPVQNPLEATLVGGVCDGFVVKFATSGTTLVYATYVGIGVVDECVGINALAVDSAGNAYVTGQTSSPSIPLVSPIQDTVLGNFDSVVMKLNVAGSTRLFSTYLGGGDSLQNTNVTGLAVDAAGSLYLAGHTSSAEFPSVNSIQPAMRGVADVFVAKISDIADNTPTGSNVVVQPVDLGATLTFDSVTTAGVSSLIRRNGGPAPPAGFSLGTPPTYYDIKTTATFTSHVNV